MERGERLEWDRERSREAESGGRDLSGTDLQRGESRKTDPAATPCLIETLTCEKRQQFLLHKRFKFI